MTYMMYRVGDIHDVQSGTPYDVHDIVGDAKSYNVLSGNTSIYIYNNYSVLTMTQAGRAGNSRCMGNFWPKSLHGLTKFTLAGHSVLHVMMCQQLILAGNYEKGLAMLRKQIHRVIILSNFCIYHTIYNQQHYPITFCLHLPKDIMKSVGIVGIVAIPNKYALHSRYTYSVLIKEVCYEGKKPLKWSQSSVCVTKIITSTHPAMDSGITSWPGVF